MAGAYGLSRIVGGAVEGLNETEKRRDRETNRQRSETQFDQQQDDRSYNLARRGVTDQREDEQYAQQQEKQERFKAGGDALRNWMTSGDLSGVNSYLNDFTSEGIGHNITKNADGSYSSVMTVNGKDSEAKVISDDDIGSYMQRVMAQDPYVEMMAQNKAKASGKEKGLDRKHDLAKIRAKGDEDRKTQAAKGVDGKSGSAAAKQKLSIEKELNDIAVQDYGSLFGDQWSFDTTRDKSMRAAQADLSSAIYYSSSDPSTNGASRQALQKMRELLVGATSTADAALDEGKIDKKDYDNLVADLIDEAVTTEISSLAPKPGQSLQRGQPGKTEPSGSANDLEAIRRFKAMSPEEQNNARPYLEKHLNINPDELDKMLNSDFANDQGVDNAPRGTSGNSLMRNASAATPTKAETKAKTEKKPKLSRQEKRREGKKSQKEHSKIAVSEYKNEWINMDDKDKLEWWSDNAQALKASSPRSHKKANKEIIEIRNKSKIGRPARAK